MIWRLLADLVVLLHLAFVAFAVAGGLLALRWPRVVWLHLPACAWAALVMGFALICPLTPLENALRALGGEAGYSGGFVAHYLTPLLYPHGITRSLQLAMGAVVVGVNGVVYAVLWRRGALRRRTLI
ncbi:MAG: DUF2784 domain-containing protein [Nitrospirota bacterium]|nr:DUF2784 domain-containing protein [Nitrospirota bacterium]